jgi:hypothetical protein
MYLTTSVGIKLELLGRPSTGVKRPPELHYLERMSFQLSEGSLIS